MTQELIQTRDIIEYREHMSYPLIPRETPDEQFVELWLHGRPEETQKAYRREANRLLLTLQIVGEEEGMPKSLRSVTLPDILTYLEMFSDKERTTQARVVATIKSLFSFAKNTGYMDFNVGAVIRSPKVKRKLARRIMSEAQVQRIINLEKSTRNHTLLLFLYASGARVSEVCKLYWIDVKEREQGMCQVTLDGKGDKERVVLLPASVYSALLRMRKEHEAQGSECRPDDPVFASRGGGRKKRGAALARSQVHRIVEQAAVIADIETYQVEQIRNVTYQRKEGKVYTPHVVKLVRKSRVSPHWFRHAHATHAVMRDVPLHIIKETLGHSSIAITGQYQHASPTSSSALALAV